MRCYDSKWATALHTLGEGERGEREPLSPSVMRPLLPGLVFMTAETIKTEPVVETGRDWFQLEKCAEMKPSTI